MKKDTRYLVSVALMAAIVILLANTPLGMIQLPIIKATTVHIPFGTGIIGSLVSYPVMAFIMGRDGLNAFFYTPMFISATIMGGAVAYVFLKALSKAGLLAKFQRSLGAKVYDKTVRKSAEERA